MYFVSYCPIMGVLEILGRAGRMVCANEDDYSVAIVVYA